MLVDDKLFEKYLLRPAGQSFQCRAMGLFVSPVPEMMSFLDDAKYLEGVTSCKDITVLLTTPELGAAISRPDLKILISEDPRFDFFTLRNGAYRAGYQKVPSRIASTAQIHPRASVSDFNVTIGENSFIGPNASILPDVSIGSNCIIQANAVLGSDGFEYKRTKQGLLAVFHDGRVVLDDEVEIGANSCLDKGIWGVDTRIGFQTKIDNLVHVAHSVQVGARCLIIASAMLGGSVILGDDVWVGPHANIAPQLKIGDKAFITLGSVVTKDVGAGEWVTGNFAVPHSKFLRNLKRSLTD